LILILIQFWFFLVDNILWLIETKVEYQLDGVVQTRITTRQNNTCDT